MKKIFIFIILVFTGFLGGCEFLDDFINDDQLNVPTKIEIDIGEFYVLDGFVSYESTNTIVVSVSSDGLIKGLSAGEASILANTHTQTHTILVVVTDPHASGDTEFIRDLIVDIINVGQGDAILIQLPTGENMMIDCGRDISESWNNIKTTLDSYEIEVIHHLIITHNHSDHYALVPNLLDEYTVEQVYSSGSTRTNPQYLQIMQSIADAGLEIFVVEVGDKIIDEEGLTLQVVAARQTENENHPNENSVMAKLTYFDNTFMLTGDGGFDTPRDGEHQALASGIDLQSDILKVGHHGSGSASGEPFLAAVQPKYAILTTRVNSSTHPHPAAIQRLEDAGATIFLSHIHGTITIIGDGETYDIRTQYTG